jgi:hypothetical protein
MEVPLMMVTLSVFEWENINCDDSAFSSMGGSPGFIRAVFTATNPVEGE